MDPAKTLANLRSALGARYAIEHEVGTGGMATVYLAHDVRHGRHVAIKVLHADLGATLGPDRFLTEIKTTARLQHPHILPLLDSGQTESDGGGGLLYYVMPYVDGETLRDRLQSERLLPIEDALGIAREVADALTYAHAQGVIHRDIKPENILIHGGHALVADFGIALAVQQAGGVRLTQSGLSLGTPQYMAPEQAMGEKTIDSRTDIYALGAVTYEMLVGDPPFTGSTVQSIVAKIISEKPIPLTVIRDTVPLHVEAAVLKALARFPADRFATADAFIRALDAQTSGATFATYPVPQRAQRARRKVAITATTAIALLVAGWALGRSLGHTTGSPATQRHYSVAMPDFVATSDRGFALSPDGAVLAYTGSTAGGQDLRVNRLAEGQLLTVPGTDFARTPMFSPDGQTIAYQSLSDGQFYRVSADGRSRPERFAGARIVEPVFAVWSEPDTIFAVSERALYRVVAAARAADTLLRLADSTQTGPIDIGKIGPLVLISTLRPTAQTLAFDLRTSKLSQFVSGFYRPSALSSRVVLLTGLSGDLFAAPVDATGLRRDDKPVAVLRGPQTLLGNKHFAVSPADNGTLVYFDAAEPAHLLFVDAAGRVMARASTSLGTPRFSPDGGRVAGMKRAPNSPGGAIWVYDIDRGVATRVSAGGDMSATESGDSYPSWSPDGRRVLFARINPTTNAQDVYWQDLNGGPAEVFVGGKEQERDLELARTGPLGVYRVRQEKGGDIWLLDRHTTPMTVRPLIATPADEAMPTLSWDGKWLAYVSDESGRREVYVCDLPGATRRWQVSRDGGGEPVWAPNGQTLYYRSGDALMAVSIRAAGTELVAGPPRLLFHGNFVSSTLARAYDVSPDGSRFVFEEAPETQHAHIVINWFQNWPKALQP